MGGLPIALGEIQAIKYARKQVVDVCGYECVKAYVKGQYNGIVFMAFDNERIRDLAVHDLRTSKLTIDGAKIWTVPDLPLPI